MKLGIIGLSRSGKSTIFEALTQNILPKDHKREHRINTIRVPDQRVDMLSQMFKPKKTFYAQIEYFLPARLGQIKEQHMTGLKIRRLTMIFMLWNRSLF